MERIKQALDKARAERGSEVGATPGRANETNGSGPIGSTPIQYLQTQVHELDQTVLRENRVIYGGDDVVGLTAYKLLRTQVMQRMAVRGWNALAVTSPTPGDGKTTTAINLAISLAR